MAHSDIPSENSPVAYKYPFRTKAEEFHLIIFIHESKIERKGFENCFQLVRIKTAGRKLRWFYQYYRLAHLPVVPSGFHSV